MACAELMVRAASGQGGEGKGSGGSIGGVECWCVAQGPGTAAYVYRCGGSGTNGAVMCRVTVPFLVTLVAKYCLSLPPLRLLCPPLSGLRRCPSGAILASPTVALPAVGPQIHKPRSRRRTPQRRGATCHASPPRM